MQQGLVDVCIVGADRVSANGDVANKIGTYLKALAADDNDIPFYVAIPEGTLDFEIKDGVKDIPIETRSEDEVKYIKGLNKNGKVEELLITPKSAKISQLPVPNATTDVPWVKYDEAPFVGPLDLISLILLVSWPANWLITNPTISITAKVTTYSIFSM